mmetsp:Transcript_21033/g.45553  ORF Transcript_21033/g.45553 Transcript_21033/m.45553 type:complete len:368 (-) Transcript_21033:103-1206(-)|eukprot:CAMPEP_0206439546 /NCGR_PEP_ID=MMETSP0324_2-20121206/12273_1 /ASSEMBLY_ACC=CAM_ASM_000836 /TAXON_ID=2866 /ORGANISM="Crypthecodinium cohnii, Strain Seligo" /LENGTH=367 /DNA_ID=CAMNT_0053907183 /DNA_START=33 /DNA_END=1136 /DNA_ORIENTATION=-
MAVPLLLSDALASAGTAKKKGSPSAGERTPSTKPVATPENDALTPMKVHLPSKAPAGQGTDEGYSLFGNSPWGSNASTFSGAHQHPSERSPGAESEGRALPAANTTLPTSLLSSFGGLINDSPDLNAISLEPSKVLGAARWASNESAGLSPAKRSPAATPIGPVSPGLWSTNAAFPQTLSLEAALARKAAAQKDLSPKKVSGSPVSSPLWPGREAATSLPPGSFGLDFGTATPVSKCASPAKVSAAGLTGKQDLSFGSPVSVSAAAPPPGLELPIARNTLDRPVPVLPSLGSENHSVGTCRPCAWFWKEVGCQNGQSCNYCHLCDEGALKAKKKSKHTMKRLGLATPTTTPLPSNQAKFALSLSSLI